jgi:hypothetical protein
VLASLNPPPLLLLLPAGRRAPRLPRPHRAHRNERSSQFKYYPYLLALSNPKKIAGAGAFPPLRPPLRRCAARWAAAQSPSSKYPDRRESALLGPRDLDPSPPSASTTSTTQPTTADGVSCEPKLHRQRQEVGLRAASGCRSGRPPGAAMRARVYTHNLI